MKKYSFYLLCICMSLLLNTAGMAQAGKYAGPVFKQLLGSIFTDEKNISGLEDYEMLNWQLINRLDDPERLFLHDYHKGADHLILFTVMTDTASSQYEILDILEVKNVPPNYGFAMLSCRQNKTDNREILALVKQTETEYRTVVKKAWIVNRDKRSFRPVLVKGIDCLNEEYESH